MVKVAVVLAPGFEEMEALAPVDLLRRANFDVDMIGLKEEVTGSHGITVKADKVIIATSVNTLADNLKQRKSFDLQTHHENKRNITNIFWGDNNTITRSSKHPTTSLPPELVVLYELLSFYDLVEQFYKE